MLSDCTVVSVTERVLRRLPIVVWIDLAHHEDHFGLQEFKEMNYCLLSMQFVTFPFIVSEAPKSLKLWKSLVYLSQNGQSSKKPSLRSLSVIPQMVFPSSRLPQVFASPARPLQDSRHARPWAQRRALWGSARYRPPESQGRSTTDFWIRT